MRMVSNCFHCQQPFTITERDLAFYQKVSPRIKNQAFPVLPPTHCPDCRMERRMITRNDYSLYNRSCDLCHKSIISAYADSKDYPVYCKDCWWSDQWDATGIDATFDWNRPFFTQFSELRNKVPRLALINRNAENSDYIHYASNNKNCYLIFNADGNQDCYYSDSIDDCQNSLDLFWSGKCELSYELISGHACYNSQFCRHSDNLSDCYFCQYCDDCHDCFGCFGLAHKQYYIYNQPYTKEEYQEKLKGLLEKKSSHQGLEQLKREVNQFFLTLPHRYATITDSEDCTGDYLHRCQRCDQCYQITRSQDCKFVTDGGTIKDSYDGNYCGYLNSELMYEVQDCWFGYRMLFSTTCWNCYEMYYSDHCFYSNNCFGCIGLRRKQYCIFNQQYTKEAYEKLLPKMIEHMMQTKEWSEFFPKELSLFTKTETARIDGIDKGKAISNGSNIPDHINEVDDSILQYPLACENCSKSFLILPQELSFYRKHCLPLPTYCFVCRQRRRAQSLPKRQLYQRNCQKCQIELLSPYAPSRQEIIYCHPCYQHHWK